jgi:ribosome biogenesis protein ENP2
MSIEHVFCYRDGLNLAVGTSTGLVLMYDIRSNKPMLTKDHMYGLPIKKVLYHTGYDNDFVLSMDSQVKDSVFLQKYIFH